MYATIINNGFVDSKIFLKFFVKRFF